MAIFGIVNQTSPVGQVATKQFREAADAATALTDFVNSFTPAKDPADWLAFDTGWVSPQQPNFGSRWAYDFDSPALVQISASSIVEVVGTLAFDDGGAIAITQDGSWQTLRRFVLASDRLPQPARGINPRFVIRSRFAYQSTGGNPQLRITQNGALYGQAKVLSDNPGWSRNAFGPTGQPPAGMSTYTIDGDRAGATLFEIRALVIELGWRLD
jgi:hypothetical protein